MQLKRPGAGLRAQLLAASCTLLGATAAHADDAIDPALVPTEPARSLDGALAYYHESDGRVTAIEPVISYRKSYGDDRALGLKLTFDSLSGGSPNGAIASTKAQTFATPSGKSLNAAPQTYTTASGQVISVAAPVYVVAPGQLPIDPNYHDQRLAASGSYELPLTRLVRTTLGGALSWEHDFVSTSLNGTIARDFNDKNTTLSAGVNGEFDVVKPIGGAPVPGSDYTLFEKTGNHSKHDANVVLGLTQVMTRRWLTSLSVSYDHLAGYLNDPYKIVSIVDAGGNVTGYLFEKRPETRDRRSAFLESRVALDHAMIAADGRYMTDDWGVRSQTLNLRLRLWDHDRDRYLEPSLRWYKQTAANFYAPWLLSSGPSYVEAASADSRLAPLHAFTVALKYAVKMDDGSVDDASEIAVRAQFYRQTQDHRTPGPGVLQTLDLYPGLKAVMLSVEYRTNL
ncbi:MAG: DUF3570 domain-containing protein [Proteobacteria bacterium]|nr:DUF3570 domain-containing protein [Pseudomonadota bacterium]